MTDHVSHTGRNIAIGTGLGIVAIVLLVVFLIFNSASCQRELKSFQSDFGGGIERTVTLYDYDGDVIQEWHGTFDMSEDDNEVYFDLDGRRVIVQGGIVVVQEESQAEYEARVAERVAA